MRILSGPIFFEWDKGNIGKNLTKHGVLDKETEEVFVNSPKFILEDIKHSSTEKRYMVWGRTNGGKFLTEIFTIRQNKIRIISARYMSRKERKRYEEKIKNYS